jgi:hypothetical protein
MRCLHFVIPLAVALGATAAPFAASAQIGFNVTVTEPPPELPVYEQPPLPAPGYIFQPGYWAYGDAGYFWVPATWVEPPEPGLLWTPGYWGWNGGRYLFNTGYWGPTVGYYGGIDYGFGYGGLGYEGGYWRGGNFFYNGAVNRFGGVHVTNVYVRNVTRVTVNRYAFNGPGGVNREPTPAERAAAGERHIAPTPMQVEHVQAARQNHALLASVNHGRPAVLATPRPLGATAMPHPTARSAMAPGHTGVAQPHRVARTPEQSGMHQPMAPHAPTSPRASAPLTPHPMQQPRAMQPHPMEARPTEARPMAPRPMEARPMQQRPIEASPMAPHAMAPRPMAPRPMAAPAPHPAPAGHEEKPRG